MKSDEKIRALLAECEDTATSHRIGQRLFGYLSVVARESTCAAEAGRLLTEHVSAEGDDLDEWIALHRELINMILNNWYAAARLHQQQQGVTK